jgi:hypothetical protein
MFVARKTWQFTWSQTVFKRLVSAAKFVVAVIQGSSFYIETWSYPGYQVSDEAFIVLSLVN